MSPIQARKPVTVRAARKMKWSSIELNSPLNIRTSQETPAIEAHSWRLAVDKCISSAKAGLLLKSMKTSGKPCHYASLPAASNVRFRRDLCACEHQHSARIPE